MDISVSHTFGIKCLNQPVALYIAAYDTFSFEVNGQKGTGTDNAKDYSFSVPTTGIACGNLWGDLGQQVKLNINITNTNDFWKWGCSGDQAGVVFGIISPDCPACSIGKYFE